MECDEKINHPGHHRLNKKMWTDLKNRLENNKHLVYNT